MMRFTENRQVSSPFDGFYDIENILSVKLGNVGQL